jgi:uncharacterized protein YjbI with pentapeptide repeats
MPERPDVSTQIQLNHVEALTISNSAIAKVVLRGATTAGQVSFERVSVTQNLDFAEALFDAPVSFEQVEVQDDVSFAHSTIRAPVAFGNCIFQGHVSFDESHVEAPLRFEAATFAQELRFQKMLLEGPIELTKTCHKGSITFTQSSIFGPIEIGHASTSDIMLDEVNADAPIAINSTTVSGMLSFRRGSYDLPLSLSESTFLAGADLTEISARGAVEVTDVKFEKNVSLHGGSYTRPVSFTRSVFQGDTVFDGSIFYDRVSFQGVTFQGRVQFQNVVFNSSVSFADVIFEQPVSFQGAQFCAEVIFREVSFRDDVDFDLVSVKVSFHKTLFSGQVSLRFGWADVTLEESDFPGPTRLGTSWLNYPLSESLVRALERAGKTVGDRRPRLLTLTGSNVSNLVLTDLSLKFCRFAGANNLDRLRLEQADPFSITPRGWHFSTRWPFLVAWTARGAVAEEHFWRVTNAMGVRKEGWLAPLGGDVLPEQAPQAESIQRIYRDLRKGREDQKDEPGAADFYYGEMEMRRHATTHWIERRVLDLYWLTSGYALRAWRALAALLVLLLAAAIVFMVLGFDRNGGTELRVARVQSNGQVVYARYDLPAPAHDFGTALSYSIESATSLLRSPQPRPLTVIGQVTEFVLRLLGPGLLGLAVLSLRGRVKR